MDRFRLAREHHLDNSPHVMVIRPVIALILWVAMVLPLRADDTRPPLTVFAAASLGEALASVVADWPGEVSLSLGGSGAIARQVDQGAPADVVLLANVDWMGWLEDRGRLVAGSRRSPLGNEIVLVGPPGASPLASLTPDSVVQRLGPRGRIAIGEHRSVPAGQYARAWMEQQGLWEPLRPYLAEVENVRAALALVSRAEVALAIVYTSDVVASPDSATAVWTIPPTEQPEILYSMAALTPEGVALVEWLASADALAEFERFGFSKAGD